MTGFEALTFGSLFTGIGGIDLGFERAGLRCLWQCEIDLTCRLILARRFPGVHCYHDARKLDDTVPRPDVLCGGFPCQDLSQAGRKDGLEGSRSRLWFTFADVIRALRPRFVLVENVSGLLTANRRPGEPERPAAMARVLGDLAGLGYVGCWRSFRVTQFGGAHLRKRVFVLGVLANSRDGFVSAEGRRSGRRDGPRPAGALLADNDLSRSQNRKHAPQEKPDQTSHRSEYDRLSMAYRNGAGRGLVGSRGVFDGLRPASGDDAHGCDAARGMLAHCTGQRLEVWRVDQDAERARQALHDSAAQRIRPDLPRFAPGPSDGRWPAIIEHYPELAPSVEPDVCRVADGLSAGLDRALSNRRNRLACLGNAVVPQIAEWWAQRIIEVERSVTEWL